MYKKYSLSISIILIVTSCSRTNMPGGPAGVDVYITGNGSLNTIVPTTVGRYWKNNKPFDLPLSTVGYVGQRVEYTSGITMAGNDLYICGFGFGNKNGISGYNYTAKYWKNGVSVNLTDGSTIAYASGIGISGTDVYVIGTESSTDFHQTFGKYWKNGVGVILSGGRPTGIATSGKDVYISGVMPDTLTQTVGTAVYWKNDTLIRLSDGSSDAQANSITVNDSDIYVAGYIGKRAVYWKNQIPVYLTDGSTTSYLVSISVEGSDILVAGKTGTVATYWKNGNSVTVGDSIDISDAALAGGDAFVVGNINRYVAPAYPGYWINNLSQPVFDSSSKSSISRILVIRQ